MTAADMSFAEFMRLVLDALESAEVEYMIGGAVAVWVWGDPRTTRDFDVIINVPVEKMGRLSQEPEKRAMLVPHEVILDVFLETRADLPVNAIHLYTGYKAELFLVRPDDEYRAVAFNRRRLADMGPPLGEVFVHAPEDLILNKLRYFSISQQPKHTRDITSILMEMGDKLDVDYIAEWAERFDLMALWEDVWRRAMEQKSARGEDSSRRTQHHRACRLQARAGEEQVLCGIAPRCCASKTRGTGQASQSVLR